MNKLLLIAATTFSLPIYSQYTLTQTNHAPAVPDTYEMFSGTVGLPGGAGTGVKWDFSNLVTGSTAAQYSASNTPVSTLPKVNVSVHGPNGEVSHYKSAPDSLLYFGGKIVAGAMVGTMTYTDAAVEAVYPMDFNKVAGAPISGTIAVTAPLSIDAAFTGTSHVIVDGTGTIVLPGGGTYSNSVRVVTTQTFVATSSFANGDVERKVYSYYAQGIKAPVISIAILSATLPMPFGASSTTVVLRNKNAPGIISTPNTTTSLQGYEQPADIAVFPNPASSQLHFALSGKDAASVTLFDLTGKEVAMVRVKESSATIDVQSLHNGVYFYKVTDVSGRQLGTGKVTVFN